MLTQVRQGAGGQQGGGAEAEGEGAGQHQPGGGPAGAGSSATGGHQKTGWVLETT